MLIRGLTLSIPLIIWVAVAATTENPAFGQSDPEIDNVPDRVDGFNNEDVIEAVQRAIAPIEKSMAVYREQRQCFSCHHHAHPIIALSEIANRGFAVDQDNLLRQLDNTVTETANVRDRYAGGKSIGGGVDTAGYTLLAMKTGDRQADETTHAMVEWMLAQDQDEAFWTGTRNRAPAQTSDVTRTWLCIEALHNFGTDDQTVRIKERLTNTGNWLLLVDAGETEDQVARLRAFRSLGDCDDEIAKFADQLIAQQRKDGGWAQTSEMQSDAYATGTVLMALHQVAGLSPTNDVYQKGASFLMSTQLPDGTWRVSTRATPVQTYFESGFPHGKDQFISMTATCWAATALALTFEPKDPDAG